MRRSSAGWGRNEDVEALFRRLAAAGLALPDAGTITDVTSCPGAEACRLAVTQSRGLGKLLGDHLRDRPDLVAAVPGLDIKIGRQIVVWGTAADDGAIKIGVVDIEQAITSTEEGKAARVGLVDLIGGEALRLPMRDRAIRSTHFAHLL